MDYLACLVQGVGIEDIGHPDEQHEDSCSKQGVDEVVVQVDQDDEGEGREDQGEPVDLADTPVFPEDAEEKIGPIKDPDKDHECEDESDDSIHKLTLRSFRHLMPGKRS